MQRLEWIWHVVRVDGERRLQKLLEAGQEGREINEDICRWMGDFEFNFSNVDAKDTEQELWTEQNGLCREESQGQNLRGSQ